MAAETTRRVLQTLAVAGARVKVIYGFDCLLPLFTSA